MHFEPSDVGDEALALLASSLHSISVRAWRLLFCYGGYLITYKLSQNPHRLGETLSRSMYQPDIPVKGVLSQIDRSYTCGPFLMGLCLWHQRYAYTFFYQFDDGLQFIQFANFLQGEMHLSQETINLPAAER